MNGSHGEPELQLLSDSLTLPLPPGCFAAYQWDVNSVCVYFAFIHNSILGSARHGGKGELKLVVSFQLQ